MAKFVLLPLGGVQWCSPYEVCSSRYSMLSGGGTQPVRRLKIIKPQARSAISLSTVMHTDTVNGREP